MPENKDRRREILDEMRKGGPRVERAHLFANHTIGMLRDFLPPGRECYRLIYDYLIEIGYEQNLQVINVPPEWDALDKMALERAMLDRKVSVIDRKFGVNLS